MKMLLHICCSCCLTYPLRKCIQDGYDLIGYWYNPNIHPYAEYRKRLQSLASFARNNSFPVVYDQSYELEKFLQGVLKDLEGRCLYCYAMRLRKTAQYAREEGFDLFSTTLLVSPYQKHEKIKALGEEIGQEVGVEFLYDDLRPNFKDTKRAAREEGLYSQKYCGCIFSEKERYLRKPWKS